MKGINRHKIGETMQQYFTVLTVSAAVFESLLAFHLSLYNILTKEKYFIQILDFSISFSPKSKEIY